MRDQEESQEEKEIKANTLFTEGKFEVFDEIIQQVDLERLDSYLIVAFLGASGWAKDKLLSRPALVQRAREALMRKVGPERTTRIMEPEDRG